MNFSSRRPRCALVALALVGGCRNPDSSPDGGTAIVARVKVYVANSGSATVTVLDADDYSPLATVPVGTGPSGIAVDETRHRAYVANSGSDTLSVIDTLTDTVAASINTGPGPSGVAVDPVAGRAYVTNGGSNEVSVVDTTTDAVVATVAVSAGPSGLAVDSLAHRLYVACSGAGALAVVDTGGNTVVATLTVAAVPTAVAVDPLTRRVYVTSRASNRVAVIDATSATVVGELVVGGSPSGVAVDPNDDRVYVACSLTDTISQADPYEQVVATSGARPGPEAVTVDPRSDRVLVANRGDGSVNVLRSAGFGTAASFVATVPVGASPVAIALALPERPAPSYPHLPAPGLRWRVQPVPVDRAELASVATDGARFVAVGAGGLIRTSADGVEWVARSSNTTNDLTSVAFLGGRFVALGAAGTILTSPDAVAWTARASGTVQRLDGLAFDGARYVAVGSGGAVVTSSDGVSWTAGTVGTTATLRGVAVGSGQYVAVGDGAVVLTSTDAVTWKENMSGFLAATLHPGTASAVSANLGSVVFAGGLFVAAGGGADGTGAVTATFILTSPDGLSWTGRPGVGSASGRVAYGDGRFLVAAPELDGFYGSTDAVTWTLERTSPVLSLAQAFAPSAATFGGGAWVAVGPRGAVGTSRDGTTWSRVNVGTTAVVASVTAADGGFAALAQGGYDSLRSADGATFVSRAPIGLVDGAMSAAGTSAVIGLRFLGGQYAAVDNQGRVATSPDGVTWIGHLVPGLSVNGELTSVAWGNGAYVVVGVYGTIASSPDGVTWTVRRRLDTNQVLFDVEFLAGKFQAVGQAGVLLTSADGVTWSESRPLATNYNTSPNGFGAPVPHSPAEFHGIAYGNGRYVISGVNRASNNASGSGYLIYFPSLLTSSDGVSWTEQADSPEGASGGLMRPGVVGLDRVVFADARFVLLCRQLTASPTASGLVFTSSDGVSWVDRTPPTTAGAFEDVAYADGRLLLVGGGSQGPLVMTSP